MSASLVLPEIERLDPLRDHQRIVHLTARYDFPFDSTRAAEMALFRTFAVPGVSALLDRTGEFFRGPQKRYDDTDLIVSEMLEHGYDSPRGRAALRRMNQIHGRFDIPNDLYLYVLSTFVFEPLRWNARFGWRPLVEKERLAAFYFWREIGRRMGIKEIPETLDAFERFNVEFERTHFTFAAPNRRIAEATLRTMCGWFPRPLRGPVRRGVIALMDEPLRKAVGLEPVSPRFTRWVLELMRLRTTVMRNLPRRRKPVTRTGPRRPSYPQGYAIGQLGPQASPRIPV